MITDKEDVAHSYLKLLPWLVVLVAAVLGYALVVTQPKLISDEGFHALQVWSFYTKENEMLYNITVPPTYHAIMGFIVRQIGVYHDFVLRFVTLAIGLLTLPLFQSLVAKFYPEHAPVRMLQFFFLPILFPMFFIVYTDVWTLGAIAACVLCVLHRRFFLAAALGLFAVSMRQTAILWVGFALALTCFDRVETAWLARWSAVLRNFLVKGFFFFFVFAAFAVFVYYNGGIAIGDKSAHEPGFNPSNLYLFLAVAWLLMLPTVLQTAPAAWELLKKPWVAVLVVAGLVAYLGTFGVTHSYNHPNMDFFLRNQLLKVLTESLAARVALYVPIAWMALTLAAMRLPQQRLYWLYGAIALSLLPHSLIEQRYFYPGLMLLLAWRPPCKPAVEVATLACYVVLATGFAYGAFTMRFFF